MTRLEIIPRRDPSDKREPENTPSDGPKVLDDEFHEFLIS